MFVLLKRLIGLCTESSLTFFSFLNRILNMISWIWYPTNCGASLWPGQIVNIYPACCFQRTVKPESMIYLYIWNEKHYIDTKKDLNHMNPKDKQFSIIHASKLTNIISTARNFSSFVHIKSFIFSDNLYLNKFLVNWLK